MKRKEAKIETQRKRKEKAKESQNNTADKKKR
jgi:hypothetical protein